MPDGGTALGGGGMGGLLPLLLGGGMGGSSSGLSPLLLLLLLGQSSSCGCSSSSTTDGGDPSTFADVLTANIGRRVRLTVDSATLYEGQTIIATIRSVNSDYVALDNVCVNGIPQPVLSRLNLKIAAITGLHRLTTTDEFLQLSCVLGSCFF